MLLLGSSLSHPGVGRMGGTSTAPHFASITLAPLQCSEVLSRVSHCCVGRGWWPGPILGLCEDPAHSRVPQPGQLGHVSVPSPVSTAVTQLVPLHWQPPCMIQVGGIHFPGCSHQSCSPGTAHLWGCPGLGVCRDLLESQPGTGTATSKDREGREPYPLSIFPPTPSP